MTEVTVWILEKHKAVWTGLDTCYKEAIQVALANPGTLSGVKGN